MQEGFRGIIGSMSMIGCCNWTAIDYPRSSKTDGSPEDSPLRRRSSEANFSSVNCSEIID
jgi:hypothetical protein